MSAFKFATPRRLEMPNQTAFMPSMHFTFFQKAHVLILIGLKYAMVKAKTNMPVPSDVINRSESIEYTKN